MLLEGEWEMRDAEAMAIIERAREYCEGYSDGLFAGIDNSADSPTGSGPYVEGFKRGFEVGRSEANQRLPEKAELGDIRSEFNALDSYGLLGAEEQERWKHLNENIRVAGRTSWEDLLLKLYANLRSFTRSCVTLSNEETSALDTVSQAVVTRFAETDADTKGFRPKLKFEDDP